LKFRSGKGKSFGNADVIFRLAILRGGFRNAKIMQLGGMQVIVLLELERDGKHKKKGRRNLSVSVRVKSPLSRG
jgi:hypothetical protein